MNSLYSTSSVDGLLFKKMLVNGFKNLCSKEKQINDMNVFPVPDGDTGTNMRLTVMGGLTHAKEDSNLSAYLDCVTEGMLLGARGNSGVILSQIFKGISMSLTGLAVMGVDDFINALICGYKNAYASLSNPVEGTILTVAREGTEYFAKYTKGIPSFGQMFEIYLDGMHKSLAHTPELLQKLKEAQVTDSGAFGFIVIVEGMAEYLNGNVIENSEDVEEVKQTDYSKFTGNSTFEFGYCMEFLLRLMSSKTDLSAFSCSEFSSVLSKLGESLVCVQNDSIVKVHIHVFKPSPVIELAQKYGEFLSFKLENMNLQHNETIVDKKKNNEHFDLAVIAPVNGSAIADVLRSFSNVTVIESPSSINTSAKEFTVAIENTNADKIVIMPNNGNVYNSAIQAVSLCKQDNVSVIKTDNVVQCYYALAMDDPSCDVESRIKAFEDNAKAVNVISIAKATRHVKINGVECRQGEFVGYLNGNPKVCRKTPIESAKDVLSMMGDVSVSFGFAKNSELAESFSQALDTTVSDGQQDTYDLIMGVVL